MGLCCAHHRLSQFIFINGEVRNLYKWRHNSANATLFRGKKFLYLLSKNLVHLIWYFKNIRVTNFWVYVTRPRMKNSTIVHVVTCVSYFHFWHINSRGQKGHVETEINLIGWNWWKLRSQRINWSLSQIIGTTNSIIFSWLGWIKSNRSRILGVRAWPIFVALFCQRLGLG